MKLFFTLVRPALGASLLKDRIFGIFREDYAFPHARFGTREVPDDQDAKRWREDPGFIPVNTIERKFAVIKVEQQDPETGERVVTAVEQEGQLSNWELVFETTSDQTLESVIISEKTGKVESAKYIDQGKNDAKNVQNTFIVKKNAVLQMPLFPDAKGTLRDQMLRLQMKKYAQKISFMPWKGLVSKPDWLRGVESRDDLKKIIEENGHKRAELKR